jgi:hypothetical protein
MNCGYGGIADSESGNCRIQDHLRVYAVLELGIGAMRHSGAGGISAAR